MPTTNTDPAKLVETLWSDIVWLNLKWHLFEGFFHSRQDNYEVMNRSSSSIFLTLRETLIDDVLLTIARLLDNPDFGSRQNAALALAARELPATVVAAERQAIVEAIAELRTQ